MEAEYCVDCLKDDNVFCKRNPDAQCLECGAKLCAGHIAEHLREVHCMSLNMDYCSNVDEAKVKQDLATLAAAWENKVISGRTYNTLRRRYKQRRLKPLSEMSDGEFLNIRKLGTVSLQEIRRLFPSPN